MTRETVGSQVGARLRRPGWYVAYGVMLVGSIVWAVVLWIFEGFSSGHMAGLPFSGVVFAVLAAGCVALPALAGGRAPRSVIGGWLASWSLSLGLLVAASPVLIVAALAGGVSPGTFAVSLLLTAVELGVIAALVTAVAVLVRSSVASVLLGYLAVALLALGTAAVAPLAGSVKEVTVTTTLVTSEYDEETETLECLPPTVTTTVTPTALPNWVVLGLNPFVVVADASAADRYAYGQPRDWFGTLAKELRQAQNPVPQAVLDDECGENAVTPLPERPVEEWGAPAWYLGLGIHLVLAAGALAAAAAVQRRRAG
ncbi:hypothetical protein SCB71_08710 [Herbiconiux sp. KACC 21604]|uniref:hypothetical protein n=1 Tax=unclassified Herbiconiux TaxID=2618217 RepID=UPI001490DAEA|nr:hypothetical protein [Herbiconiux sp. SALV-R1]QJU53339.1 hypothetical protein HL652_06670 [Herbiconiux sp. SALV-R1]WPO88301.1 hypothetical protein SCB71_08710 [Herbiconiux sp. KACC 21604]